MVGFDEFVVGRSPRLLRLAYLLTGDHAHAEDLLQTALARSWSAWRRIAEDPEPYVRRVLVNTYNSWWRRRWNAERPTAVLPDRVLDSPQSGVDDRDEVWRALGRLPDQQRAVLVLRYFEDLTEAQIADVLGVSAGAVKGYAAKGLAKLRLDPTLLASSVLPEAPPGTERLGGVRDRIRSRRRQRLIAVGAACAVIVALVVGYALFPRAHAVVLPPTERRIAGFAEYADGHRVVAAAQGTYQHPVSFTWTPTTLDIEVLPICDGGLDIRMAVNFNGFPSNWVSCSGRGGTTFTLGPSDLARRGVKLGEPTAVTVTVDNMRTGGPGPAVGRMSLGIGERVPFDQYPFPARPARLAPLEPQTFGGSSYASVTLSAAGPHSVTVPWGAATILLCASRTPGILRVTVDGRPLKPQTWWDYQAGVHQIQLESADTSSGITAAVGSTVTVTVEAEKTSGDWYVSITPNVELHPDR
ncbi:SigE family RNA polymerase sigma factor [Longispora sp. K20-0274]|uniref:SigE family RNA polymerase sigma factor n=1 Tax=Longispora sp. K20-0274 TaxID=3088255 RepID=UPI003999629E